MAIIGFGAIGQAIGQALIRLGEQASLTSVLVRPGRGAGPFRAVHHLEDLLADDPEVVLECAGQAAVGDYGPAVLQAGGDLVLASVGALAQPRTVAALRNASVQGGRLLVAPGAVAGLDGLLAARLAGLKRVTYTSYKPPNAWRGTAAEAAFDLDHAEAAVIVFEGSAREAALAFPKNANVAVTVGLCGLGLDATHAVLVSSRKVSDPFGVIEAEGDFGRFTFEILARAAPDNPKTSLLTAYSLLQCARLGVGLPALALIGPRQADGAPSRSTAEGVPF